MRGTACIKLKGLSMNETRWLRLYSWQCLSQINNNSCMLFVSVMLNCHVIGSANVEMSDLRFYYTYLFLLIFTAFWEN